MASRTWVACFLVMLLGFVGTACSRTKADTKPPGDGAAVDDGLPERPFDYRASTLENGMQIITLEDHSTPIAAVQLWYHVGSKDEKPNRRGFAHMFEHMMFRGTQNIGPKAHFEYIRKVGGNTNAYTSFDNTTYIQVVPSNQVEMVLWLEAERMGFLKINDGYFDTERNVVAEEYRMGREQPYGTLPDRLLPQIFSKHPYAWTPIGDMDELGAADAKELQEFWNTYYVPNNAALVVVGDVKHEEVEALAKQYFGWIPRYPDPPRVTVKEPPQTKAKVIELQEPNGPVPIVGVLYRTVPLGHKDEVALEMLGNVLGGGESSRLYRDLVDERELAMVALSAGFALEDDGVLAAGAVLGPFGSRPKATLEAIREHIAKVRKDGITDEELAKARAQMLKSAVASQLTVQSKAQLLGEAALIKGDLESVNRRFSDIRKVTVQDVKRVAEEYLRPEREVQVKIEPSLVGFLVSALKGKSEKKDEPAGTEEISGEGSGKPGLKRPDTLGPTPTIAPPLSAGVAVKSQRRKLDNGLEVVVIPNDEVPFVSYRLGIEFGAYADPDGQPGVAFLTLPMLTRGTKTHGYKALTDKLDHHAITLSGSAGMDSSSVWANAVVSQADLAMEMMAEVVREPTFPAKELKKHVKQTVTGLAVTERSPEYIADRELRRRIFPGHPYERLPEGKAADLGDVESKSLATWWSKHARPDTAVLYIAGAVTPERGFEMAQKHFGPWTAGGTRPKVVVPEVPKPAKTKIYLVDRAGQQAQIRVGHSGITRHDNRFFTTRVLSEVFGGGFNARLNDTIRVKKGLTYGARGGFSAERFAGRFVVSTFSKNATVGETVSTILEEIDRIKTEAPSSKEQTEAISYIVGSFPGRRETPTDLVRDLWQIRSQGLPADYYDQYLSSVRNVTSDQVIGTARDLIDADHLVIVVVGPAKVLRRQLKNIAPVEVVQPYDKPSGKPKG